VVTHPSLERSEGWGTHFFEIDQDFKNLGWATRRTEDKKLSQPLLSHVIFIGAGFGNGPIGCLLFCSLPQQSMPSSDPTTAPQPDTDLRSLKWSADTKPTSQNRDVGHPIS
jgi:hypothetical protein